MSLTILFPRKNSHSISRASGGFDPFNHFKKATRRTARLSGGECEVIGGFTPIVRGDRILKRCRIVVRKGVGLRWGGLKACGDAGWQVQCSDYGLPKAPYRDSHDADFARGPRVDAALRAV